MKFSPVNKNSKWSVHKQLREQIIYRITTGELRVGEPMASVRAVGRLLGISFNTVSSVYKELVEEGWLVEQPGTQHIVVAKSPVEVKPEFEDLAGLINWTIDSVLRSGYSLQHFAAGLRERLLDQPPDHLLLVEPEPQLGELMRQEIREYSGLALAGCSLSDLERDPSKSNGAVLLVPIHIQDLLEFIPPQKRQALTLTFSRPDEHAVLVGGLPRPSAVGLASISPAAIETACNYLASACGDRHESYEFQMEWPVARDGSRFKRFAQYRPIFVRKIKEADVQSESIGLVRGLDCQQSEDDGGGPLLSSADLDFVDLLFCDSIAYKAVKHHRQKIRWQVLSDESLAAVKARSQSLKRDLEEFVDERRKAAEKLEAERRAAQEIVIAKQVQAVLFPQVLPAIKTLDYAGLCIQARQVGGDYFDFLNLGQERFALVIGDIVGKGIAAALLMANLQVSLRSQCAIAVNQPQQMLQSVNQQFYKTTIETAYATLFFGEYDDKSRSLRYVNCGNLPALLLHSDDKIERLDSTATVVGLFAEFDCAMVERRLGPGDTLALYTDGVTECCSPSGEEFGEHRLEEALRKHRNLSAEAMVNAVVDELNCFSPGEKDDDITLIIAHCRPD